MIYGYSEFGGVDQTTAAAQAVSEVRSAYDRGWVAVQANPDALVRLSVLGALGPLSALFNWLPWFESTQEATLKNVYTSLGNQIDDWAGRRLQWAIQGHRDDGSAYGWPQWTDQGKVISDAIQYYLNESVNGSVFLAVINAVKQTVHDVTTPTAWPTWLKVGVGLVGVGTVLNFVRRR